MEGNITTLFFSFSFSFLLFFFYFPIFSTLFIIFFLFLSNLPPSPPLQESNYLIAQSFLIFKLYNFDRICYSSFVNQFFIFLFSCPIFSHSLPRLCSYSISCHNISSPIGFVILTRAKWGFRCTFYWFQEESVNLEKLVRHMILNFVTCFRLWVSVPVCACAWRVYAIFCFRSSISHYFTSLNTS